MIKIAVTTVSIYEQALATPNVAQVEQKNQPSVAQAPNATVQAKTASVSNVSFEIASKDSSGVVECIGKYWKDGNPVVCSFNLVPSNLANNAMEFCDLVIDGSQFLDIGLNHKALQFARQVARGLGALYLTPCFSHGAFNGTDYERRAWKEANTSACKYAPDSFAGRDLAVQLKC